MQPPTTTSQMHRDVWKTLGNFMPTTHSSVTSWCIWTVKHHKAFIENRTQWGQETVLSFFVCVLSHWPCELFHCQPTRSGHTVSTWPMPHSLHKLCQMLQTAARHYGCMLSNIFILLHNRKDEPICALLADICLFICIKIEKSTETRFVLCLVTVCYRDIYCCAVHATVSVLC